MIEAMACGTPIIAFRRGSVPEVIEDGVSGLIVDGEATATEAARRVHDLDRRRVREAFEQRFTVTTMTDKYLRLYRQVGKTQVTSPDADERERARRWESPAITSWLGSRST
jgi:glycosyltransferase involved in cell wall biosynthesis